MTERNLDRRTSRLHSQKEPYMKSIRFLLQTDLFHIWIKLDSIVQSQFFLQTIIFTKNSTQLVHIPLE